MGDSNRQELTDDKGILLLAQMRATQQGIWTALPGYVTKFDRLTRTCEVQPTIKVLVLDEKGKQTWVQLPVLVDCPIVYPTGGGYTLTFPLAVGDEVLVVFSSRCIDSWFQSGGVQVQSELRMHDLSDGFVIPGPQSIGSITTNVSDTDVQLRSNDGVATIGIGPSAQVKLTGIDISIDAAVAVNITAPTINLNGNVNISGLLTAADLKTPAVLSYNVHQHGGVTNGGSETSPPAPGT